MFVFWSKAKQRKQKGVKSKQTYKQKIYQYKTRKKNPPQVFPVN